MPPRSSQAAVAACRDLAAALELRRRHRPRVEPPPLVGIPLARASLPTRVKQLELSVYDSFDPQGLVERNGAQQNEKKWS